MLVAGIIQPIACIKIKTLLVIWNVIDKCSSLAATTHGPGALQIATLLLYVE
jgi:hypothetical protein